MASDLLAGQSQRVAPNRQAQQKPSADPAGAASNTNPSKKIGPDYGGTITEVVVQYSRRDADKGEALSRVFINLFKSMPTGVNFTVLIENPGDEAVLRARIREAGLDQSRFKFVVVKSPNPSSPTNTTPWIRDDFIPIPGPNGTITLIEPGEEHQYQGCSDKNSAEALARTSPRFRVQSTGMGFQGGEIVSSDRHVFISGTSHLFGRDKDTSEAEAQFGKPVVIIEYPLWRSNALPEHIDLFITPAGVDPATGREIVLVGDPRMTGAAETDDSVIALDQISKDLENQGFVVKRIPIKIPPGNDGGNNIVTYNNVIMETRSGKKIVYMPVYGGENAKSDDDAERVYKGLGFTVVRVDVSPYAGHCGQIRCMTITIKQGAKGGQPLNKLNL